MAAYGGDGITQRILVVSDGQGHKQVKSFVLSNGVFTADEAISRIYVDGSLITTQAFQSLPAFSVDQASPGHSDSYSYDLNTNRVQDVHSGAGGPNGTTTYTYNQQDELTGQSGPAGTTTNNYDANGSLITSTTGGSVTTYTYDVRNKLVEYAVNGVTQATYAYDDDGDRVSESVFTSGVGTRTLYLTDTQNPTGYDQPIETVNGTTLTTYILGDRVLGQDIGGRPVQYLMVDGHGSTQELTTASGTITAAYQYDAFGDAINFTPSRAGTAFLFGGDAVYDQVSGLYLHGDGTRATHGLLFIQRDTASGSSSDPISLNKYLYAGANPVNENDPSGNFGLLDPLLSASDEAAEVAEEGGVADGAFGLAGDVVGDIEEDQAADSLLEAADDAGSDSAEANDLADNGLQQEQQTAEEAENGEDEDDDESGGLSWYHGTDVQSAAQILALGLSSELLNETQADGDSRGFFVTQNFFSAEKYAYSAEQRRGLGGPGVVLKASDDDIGEFLQGNRNLETEAYIPVADFPLVPFGTFRIALTP